MRIRIYRGAAEVGGTCIELEAGGSRLVLDVGRPLWAGPGEQVPLPEIRGLGAGGDPSLLGVILTHAHLDHWGLLDQVSPSVPLYTGASTARILKEAAFFSPAGIVRDWAGFLSDREPREIGPFTITPYLVDHSAFDAYALLVEAEGRRLFYTGDLRAHGRQGETFDRLVSNPPEGVHALLLEGTRVGVGGTDDRSGASEAELEQQFSRVFDETDGLVLVAYSAQNIDRLFTVYRATLNTSTMQPRDLVIDPYVEAIARATGNPDVPRVGLPRVKVFVPQSQRIKIKRAGEFSRINEIRGSRIFPEALRPQRNKLVMTFRPSMARELERAGCLDGAHLIWSMWPGYLREKRMDSFRDLLDRHNISTTTIHASGHATVADLQRLAQAIDADRIIPVHTSAPERFSEVFERVQRRSDGEWWAV